MTTIKKIKTPKKKRDYRTPKKGKGGAPWKYLLVVDDDNRKSIESEIDGSINGADIRKIINNRIRKGYSK